MKYKIIRKRNSSGSMKFYIKHNLWTGCLGEYFDDYYNAERRLKELKEKN